MLNIIQNKKKSIFVLGKYKYETDDENEYTFYNDKLHSYGDKPAKNSEFTKEWYKHGLLHRKTGPAVIIHFTEEGENNEKIFEWYKNGKLHKRDGPAFERYFNDKIDQQMWYIDGEPTPPEPGLPLRKDYNSSSSKVKYVTAEYFTDEPNKISYIWWYKPSNGKSYKRREGWDKGRENDLPTHITYYKNGNVWVKEWYKNRKRHRELGKPSYILYDQNGNITNKKYFENGIQIKK